MGDGKEKHSTRDETVESVFLSLKSYCVQLLELLHGPHAKSAAFLPDMARFLRRTPADALQPHLDFTLFPLLLLLDTAVQCRSGERSGSNTAPLSGHKVRDSVAEGVLACLEEMLGKCHLTSVNQLVIVLKKLTCGALLSPMDVSEEFREGIIRCLKAMLLRLKPCSVLSCSCKKISGSQAVKSLGTSNAQCNNELGNQSESLDCLLAFLHSQDASAAVGHWLSLLLQFAEVEVARGHCGSSSLRKEAFLTFRVLISKVGIADALAFFLPGTVSRLAEALRVSKSMVSGAAGSAGSIEHAVRGLTEYLMIVLSDSANLCGLEMAECDLACGRQNKNNSSKSVMEALRQLPVNVKDNSASSSVFNKLVDVESFNPKFIKEKHGDRSNIKRSLYVQRTKQWMEQTSEHVYKLLSATFPHLCLHPSEKVRRGLVDGIRGLLINCSDTLKSSKLMFLECLCALVCDDSEAVALSAGESLHHLFMSGEKLLMENEISEIFSRLIEKLPRVVLGSEENVAVSHAHRLLALMYYAGPDIVVDQLLGSPMKCLHLFDILRQCLGHSSQFAGSVNKLIDAKPLSLGYLLSVAELKSDSSDSYLSCKGNITTLPNAPEIAELENMDLKSSEERTQVDYELPHMPPWFVNIGSQKLYLALAGIIRLIGLSVMAGSRSDVSLSTFIDVPLEFLRRLISELRIRAYKEESWHTWYSHDSGQLLRQTSSAVCILNEAIFGLSDRSVSMFPNIFRKVDPEVEKDRKRMVLDNDYHCGISVWNIRQGKDVRDLRVYCVGLILHEFTAAEVWDLPIERSSMKEQDVDASLSLFFFLDVMMLHQVIIEGIGIFSMSLGKAFKIGGFMHSCLYLLLQNLICSNNQIRIASDAVLQVLSATCGHSSVGRLVVENADYIIDSLCRQLRQLELNPHVPNVLAAMLSYVGAADEIIPLLEEPMRAVSLELEVLGRQQHPDLTLPFLKAVREIAKASRLEACSLPTKSELFHANIKSKLLDTTYFGIEINQTCVADSIGNCFNSLHQLEYWEELFFKLNEMRRFRRIVGSLVASCLLAANPLLASMKEASCSVALDIVEDAIVSLAKVEEAYKYEKGTKAEIAGVLQLCSFNDLEDTMDEANDDADENRLLPAMNKIWPHLILCFKNKLSVAVIKRCASVLSTSVLICGGNFFVRRFRTDGPVIWKLLTSSPFRRKFVSSKDERQLVLPFRSTSQSREDPMAEVSCIKIQAAILDMISELSSNDRSSSALEAVFKKISGITVGIACSDVAALRDSSIKAISGLARIDPDLIWLLLADLYYSVKIDFPSPPAPDLPELKQLLPSTSSSSSSSSKDYLFLQYGGGSLDFDLDNSAVNIVIQKLGFEEFT